MKVQKVFDLVAGIVARSSTDPQVVLEKKDRCATSLGMNVDDEGTQVLYETVYGASDKLDALDLLGTLRENYTKEREREKAEMVIESDEEKVYTADFEVKYENGRIVIYELPNAKAW